jgi:TonB family protein
MFCFIKRFLPFALTLLMGLAVGSLFKSQPVAGNLEGPAYAPPAMAAPTVDEQVFTSCNVMRKARILSRPQPQYTESARINEVSGTVVLRAVLSSSGEVTNIRAVSGLPYGLTEKAVEAAREIQFVPAIKDGHAVSQYIQIEYNFNLY